jgi:hypothetical protein
LFLQGKCKPLANIIDNNKSQYYEKKIGESDKLTYKNDDKIRESEIKCFGWGLE